MEAMSFNWGENADDGLTLTLTGKLSFCFFRLLLGSMPAVFSLSKVDRGVACLVLSCLVHPYLYSAPQYEGVTFSCLSLCCLLFA
jgi:hypothetical protein